MKRKKSIVKTNFFLSMGFGLLMGLIFPFYSSFFVRFESQLKMIIFTAGCVAAGLLVGLIAFLITRFTILKVVRQVGEQLEIFNTGDADLSRSIILESHDELGELVAGFNQFIESMNQLLSVSQKNSDQSLIISSQLTDNMNQTSNAVTNIGSTLNNVNSLADLQVLHFASTKEALTRLNHAVITAITHVLELFSQMDHLTSQLLNQSETIEKLTGSIDYLAEKVGSGETRQEGSFSVLSQQLVNNTNDTLTRNAEAFTVLGELIMQIDGIAERTGILAINASIEAAKGGKGDGFKIIAQEVRKLSSESSSFSSRMFKSLEKSGIEIKKAKEFIGQTQNHFLKTLSDLNQTINKLTDGASDIRINTGNVRENYSNISGMLAMIKESLQDLKNETLSTQTGLRQLEDSATRIKEEMYQVKLESDDINQLALKTQHHVNVIAETVENVAAVLNKFKAVKEIS